MSVRGRPPWVAGLLAVVLGTASGCLTEDHIHGLPCTKDAHCGSSLKCELGVCGGTQPDFGDDPCATQVNECADANTLSRCVAGLAENTDCTEHCASQGYAEAFGCFVPPSTESAECFCREESTTCSDPSGAVQCTTAQNNLVECIDSRTQYTDCDQECRGLGLVAQGCSYSEINYVPTSTCYCAIATCDPAAQKYCLNDQTVAVCDGDQWSEFFCSDTVCPNGVALGCGYSAATDDFGCVCAY